MSNDARSQARNGQELYFYQRGRPRAIATRLRVPHSMRPGSILRIFYLSFRNIDKHLSGRESQVTFLYVMADSSLGRLLSFSVLIDMSSSEESLVDPLTLSTLPLSLPDSEFESVDGRTLFCLSGTIVT
ncbi:hypothetical protein P5673_006184 [Acropora cervicornis]|uniref:Uncharacterized protein n=1 Tax=Acropora cervicornis TaxID=6130 RepID=A0AAD9QXL4_ACRCE|nr:hypothetical protein P5673_006184 [Acropora cervicornis]